MFGARRGVTIRRGEGWHWLPGDEAGKEYGSLLNELGERAYYAILYENREWTRAMAKGPIIYTVGDGNRYAS